MAAFPTPLSPREVSPTCKNTEAMGPHQAFLPGLSRCSSCPSRAAGPLSSAAVRHWTSTKPSALLERRAKRNPALKVSAFQAGVGTGATRSERGSAFQAGGGMSPISPPATLYDDLELKSTATQQEIKTAYRRLARQHHPDTAPPEEKEASTTKFLQIHSAYAALSDPHSRAQYDLQLSLHSYQLAGHHNRSPKFYSRSSSSSNYYSPRTPFSSGRGRTWETDQCWC